MMNQGTCPCGTFKIALGGCASRVVVVPENITLWQMHDLIQALFGWKDCHYWEFKDFQEHRFGPPLPDEAARFANDALSPDAACLADVLPSRGLKLNYTYDLGDNWRHVITRLAAPKDCNVRCVKSEGPDGVEDGGGRFDGEDEEVECPTAEEITQRMAALDLTPQSSRTGFLEKELAARQEIICSLDDREWQALCYLGEDEQARIHPVKATERLARLPGLLPHLFPLRLPGRTMVFLCMDYSFRRYWRKNKSTFLSWRETMR